ncbi:MAG: flagellar motor protein MotA [Chthoniobacteraceae bacterium]|nr:flagellar motor protein MotA [Chthoniobacteraceae bacterium]
MYVLGIAACARETWRFLSCFFRAFILGCLLDGHKSRRRPNPPMLELFHKGGPIMWPILLTSIMALTVVLERLFFIIREKMRRDPELIEAMLTAVERGEMQEAQRLGRNSRDFIARTICYALSHEDKLNAVVRAAGRELQRYNRGLALLDTAITIAPLLGLLGTVTGMIGSFSLLGDQELGAPAAVSGGIAEALIATAFGLGVAIVALLPFNYLNAQLEQARHEVSDAASQLEAHVKGMLEPA